MDLSRMIPELFVAAREKANVCLIFYLLPKVRLMIS